jgi:hypothetical protein
MKKRMPRSSSDFCSILPATSSSWRSISVGITWINAHLHAALHQAVGRLQAQQAAADDHGALVFFAGLDHGVGVGNVAVGNHAFQVLAGDRQDEGVGAGGDSSRRSYSALHRLTGGVFGMHHAAHPVYLR